MDIYISVEYKLPEFKNWLCFASNLPCGRNLNYFNKLARIKNSTVENIVGHNERLFDYSHTVEKDFYYFIDDDFVESNTVNSQLAEHWVSIGVSEYVKFNETNFVTNPDIVGFGWCYVDEFKKALGNTKNINALAALSAAKSLIKNGAEVRVIYCFKE